MAIYNNSKYVDYSQILNALFNISTAPFKYVTIQNAKMIKACFFWKQSQFAEATLVLVSPAKV